MSKDEPNMLYVDKTKLYKILNENADILGLSKRDVKLMLQMNENPPEPTQALKDLFKDREIDKIKERVKWQKRWNQSEDDSVLPKPSHMKAGWALRDIETLLNYIDKLEKRK